jgi:hypothetical protein
MQIEKKINACEQQATIWMSKTKAIADALPVSKGKAIQFSLLEMPSKAVLSSSIRDRLRKKLITKSYLGHLITTKVFQEAIELAPVSTPLRDNVEYLSTMNVVESQQFENVCEMVVVYIFHAIAMHLNSAHKKGNRKSFEMTIYRMYVKMMRDKTLRSKTIDKIQSILPNAPSNIFFIPLLWNAFSECQSNWVQGLFREMAISKRKYTLDTRELDLPSEVQRFVGWAIRSVLLKRTSKSKDGCKESTIIKNILVKTRVFSSDIEDCVDYVSECYNFSEQILNKGGLTLVSKPMFEWAKTLLIRYHQRFNKDVFGRDGKHSMKNAWAIMQKDRFLKKLFRDGINLLDITSFSVNEYPEIVQKLHDELLYKIFHSQANQDVIEWKKENEKKMSKKDKSKVAFREGLKHDAEKHEPPSNKPVKPTAVTKKSAVLTKNPATKQPETKTSTTKKPATTKSAAKNSRTKAKKLAKPPVTKKTDTAAKKPGTQKYVAEISTCGP